MGQIYRISCKCGYEKEAYIGGGISACNISMVNRVFSDEKCKEFNNYYGNKEVKSFFVENKLAYCESCKEVITMASLEVTLINGMKLRIINDCHVCGNKIEILEESIMCPKCGEEMVKTEIGQWD